MRCKRIKGVLVVIIVISLVLISVLYTQKTNKPVEHFKRKKKGKKSKRVALDKENPEIDLEIDFDEIIDKVEEAREEAEEPGEDEDEPQDDEGDRVSENPEAELFGGANEDAGGFDASDFNGGGVLTVQAPVRAAVVPRAPVTAQGVAAQKQAIAAQPDVIFNDILYFIRSVPFPNKRLICVIPDNPKHLYVISIDNVESSKALLIGPDTLDVILEEVRPKGVVNYAVYNGSDSFDKAVMEADVKFVLFYGQPHGHPFWAWLNASQIPVTFTDYMGMIEDPQAKVAFLSQYPYFHIKTVNVKAFLPGRALKRQFVHTMMVDMCAFSNKDFKPEFYRVYDQHHRRREYQVFYELFFPYYAEILKNRVGVDASVKLKEHFVEGRAMIRIDYMLDGLVVTGTVRDIFKEMLVPKQALAKSGAKITKGDMVRLSGQSHRTLEGDFYVVDVRLGKVLLQSHVLLKQVVGFEMLTDNKAVAKSIDSAALNILIPQDQVHLAAIDRSGIYLGLSGGLHMFSIVDDLQVKDKLYRCVTSPKITLKAACNSEYSDRGERKKVVDVWDRPCMYDEECPFFGKGSNDKFRGGCGDGGYCEMPIGYDLVGHRMYTTKDGIVSDNVRFPGDIWNK